MQEQYGPFDVGIVEKNERELILEARFTAHAKQIFGVLLFIILFFFGGGLLVDPEIDLTMESPDFWIFMAFFAIGGVIVLAIIINLVKIITLDKARGILVVSWRLRKGDLGKRFFSTSLENIEIFKSVPREQGNKMFWYLTAFFFSGRRKKLVYGLAEFESQDYAALLNHYLQK